MIGEQVSAVHGAQRLRNARGLQADADRWFKTGPTNIAGSGDVVVSPLMSTSSLAAGIQTEENGWAGRKWVSNEIELLFICGR